MGDYPVDYPASKEQTSLDSGILCGCATLFFVVPVFMLSCIGMVGESNLERLARAKKEILLYDLDGNGTYDRAMKSVTFLDGKKEDNALAEIIYQGKQREEISDLLNKTPEFNGYTVYFLTNLPANGTQTTNEKH